MGLADIYYERFWGELNAPLENGEYNFFEYQHNDFKAYYPFVKRKIDISINNEIYYDTITPYGFSGPIITDYNGGDILKHADIFNKEFQMYCEKENIVSEYVRFSPWLKNHKMFENIYDLKYNNYTLGVDLEKDFFKDEFSAPCRTAIRKAIKSGVDIEFDYNGATISEFDRLYNIMANKNAIAPTYRFSRDFFEKTMKSCDGNIFLLNAKYQNEIISSAIFLHSDKYLHYHFSGNNVEYSSMRANNLILHTAAQWGAQHKKTHLHLGGAFSESLFKFKKTFTKQGIYDYYIGKKIRNKIIYDKLVEENDSRKPDFFPAYRG